MRPALLLVALLVAAPAAYAWWSGRKIRRSLDDPALAELLQARQRRLAQVTLVAVIATAFTGVPMVVAVIATAFTGVPSTATTGRSRNTSAIARRASSPARGCGCSRCSCRA